MHDKIKSEQFATKQQKERIEVRLTDHSTSGDSTFLKFLNIRRVDATFHELIQRHETLFFIILLLRGLAFLLN
jgi:hypothetical protein